MGGDSIMQSINSNYIVVIIITYDNNYDKLKVLCKNCHRLEPGHGGIR